MFLVWPMVNEQSGGYNKTGIALALLCLAEFIMRPEEARDPSKETLPSPSSRENWLSGAVPLGALIYCLHTYLHDASTLIAWSWTGYENGVPKGPLPHLHGSITLVVQCLALLFAVGATSRQYTVFGHPVWYCYGVGSSYIMYRYRDWLGYTGGLNFGFFIMTIVPHVLDTAARASHGRVARLYFTAMLTYCLLALASIWTVAYAFVPGGVYLRERTDL